MFFSLIRVWIGQQTKLPFVPSDNEWKHVLSLLQKHALQGIGFVAMQKLPREQWPPSDVTLTLTAYATKIKAKNVELNEECHEVVRRMNHDGIEAVVIKGQSNWEHYPEGLREYRCAGDIDLWTKLTNDCGIPIAVQQGDAVEYEYYKGVRGIIEYARLQCRLRGDKSQFKPLYYHVEYHTDKGTEVEMHYRPSFLCSPIRNMRMQRWFKEQYDVCLKNKCQLGFPVLTPSVNVVYQLVHLYRHVFEGGIGLRQLMDYYFALKVWHNDVMECKDLQSQGMWSEGLGTPVMSNEEIMAVLRSFGMGKFAGAVMWVLNEVFGGVNENENENENDNHNENYNENENNPQRTRRDTEGCPLADDGKECESSEFKRNLNGCPQADSFGERQLENNEYPQMSQMDTDGCPQADGGREHLSINDERLMINDGPWLLCESNEKEGRKLLKEIMKGGNFGQYDTRDAELKRGGMMKHGLWKLKRVMRLVKSYPEEALWEPWFRVYHWVWRKLELWRFWAFLGLYYCIIWS